MKWRPHLMVCTSTALLLRAARQADIRQAQRRGRRASEFVSASPLMHAFRVVEGKKLSERGRERRTEKTAAAVRRARAVSGDGAHLCWSRQSCAS